MFSDEIMQRGRLVLSWQLTPTERFLGNNYWVYSQKTMSAKIKRGFLPMNNIAEATIADEYPIASRGEAPQ